MRRFILLAVLLLFGAAPAYPWVHGAASVVASYEGLVATRAASNWITSFDTTNKQIMVRSTHIARDNITSLKIIASNFYTTGGAELGSGATATVSASVEYPSGTCTQILFSGSASGSIADGSTLTADYSTVSIPNGATFWIRQFWQSSGGALYYISYPTITGDQLKKAVSGLADQTLTCGAITGGATGLMLPLAIIAQTTKPTICVVGDSIAWGLQGLPTTAGDNGIITPTTGPLFGYSNLSAPGEAANVFVLNSTQRQKVFPYCSHAISNYGSNDLAASRTVAQIKTALTSIYGFFSAGVKVFQTTILPRPSTSNSCATLGGQTLQSFEANRVTLNTDLRSAAFGPNSGMFDASSIVETGLNTGFWDTSPSAYSNDCIHPNTFGYATVTSSGIIDTSRIHLP